SANRGDLANPYVNVILSELPFDRARTHAAGWPGTEFRRSLTPYNVFNTPPADVPVASTQNRMSLPAWDQMANGSFAAMVLIWAYEYTLDEDYLKNKHYPLLLELDTFWEAYMVKTAKPYRIDNSSAHEGNTDRNPNLDLGYIRKICHTLLDAS